MTVGHRTRTPPSSFASPTSPPPSTYVPPSLNPAARESWDALDQREMFDLQAGGVVDGGAQGDERGTLRRLHRSRFDADEVDALELLCTPTSSRSLGGLGCAVAVAGG
ncbi:unnamed protein product, partial [Alopecurus aequalis]